MHLSGPDFSIILTTHKRPELVVRAIKSVYAQSLPTWKLIVVNDSPDTDYSEAEHLLDSDKRCVYLRNKKNEGRNASMNRALESLATIQFKGHVVFLDDDDWLDPSCLKNFAEDMQDNGASVWLCSQKSTQDKSIVTKNRTGRSYVDYRYDYLLLKRFIGDATHCIDFGRTRHARFPVHVRNGEEWLYFSQVAEISARFRYLPVPGTYTDGYSESGLTATYAQTSFPTKSKVWGSLVRELSVKRMWNFPLAIYMTARLGSSIATTLRGKA